MSIDVEYRDEVAILTINRPEALNALSFKIIGEIGRVSGGTINTYSYLVWALWLIAFGVILLTGRVKPALVAHPAPRAEASAAS